MSFTIANVSGFFGDRDAAASELLSYTTVDVLTGDYLAELTMFLLWKQRQRDPSLGYARSFLTQAASYVRDVAERGMKVVTNAGGLNPAGMAAALRELADEREAALEVCHIEGDDLLPRLAELRSSGERLEHFQTAEPIGARFDAVVTANAYLGCWPIVSALQAGADVVVCPRVADASLVTGPAAWRFGWGQSDLDQLAAATVAGHIVECGPQATGGNHSLFHTIEDLRRPGFPIVEMEPDGEFVVTKAPGTGGAVTVATVTEQLLYEIEGPRYRTPDVTARFDTIEVIQQAPDRVLVRGVRGEPPPDRLKVAMNYLGGYRNAMTCVLTGPRVDAKAAAVQAALRAEVAAEVDLEFQLAPSSAPDSDDEEVAASRLRIIATAAAPDPVGRRFSSAVTALALSSYPGFFTTAPPGGASAFGVLWPTTVPREFVEPVVVTADGAAHRVPDASPARSSDDEEPLAPLRAVFFGGPRRRVRLGCLVGARSGDKGGDANIGLWARSDRVFEWMLSELDADAVHSLLPAAKGLRVDRYAFPPLRALNFVVRGVLGEGVAASTRFDPQAKSLGEFLRFRWVDAPVEVLYRNHLVDGGLLSVDDPR